MKMWSVELGSVGGTGFYFYLVPDVGISGSIPSHHYLGFHEQELWLLWFKFDPICG